MHVFQASHLKQNLLDKINHNRHSMTALLYRNDFNQVLLTTDIKLKPHQNVDPLIAIWENVHTYKLEQ